jgi:ferric-dicitrate binding protein FerR (iron transport regulator)
VTREILTLERLRRMGDDRAAALLIVRRNADDYDGADEAILDEWLAADPEHPEAWARASNVCAHFDIADDDPVLQAMRDALLDWPPTRA